MTKRILSLVLISALASCKTYYIPVESFKQQLSGFDSSKMREVKTSSPFGGVATYKIYPIDYIHAVDKNGNTVSIPNGPAIEVRITDTANQKTIFYFDLLRFDGENIMGRPSRILSSIQKTIPINAVKKIEVQNGRKNYRYIQ